MPNGAAKKKNKKSEEAKRKEEEERLLREHEEKRQRVEAAVAEARRKMMEEKMWKERMEQFSTAEQVAKKKKGEEEEANEDKRVGDKRRDSLGGSVSTSSNSSGTDSDEVLSEATKSAITSPSNELAADSPLPVSPTTKSTVLPIAEAIHSIHQVAQSVVDAGTEDALHTLSEFLPFTMTKQQPRLVKAGARNLAAPPSKMNVVAAAREESPLASSAVPRKVPTPIVGREGSGGTTTPSPDRPAFRSLADEFPAEMPGLSPQHEVEVVETARGEKEEDGNNDPPRRRFSSEEPIIKTLRHPFTIPVPRDKDGVAGMPIFSNFLRTSFGNYTEPTMVIPDHIYGENTRFYEGGPVERTHERRAAYLAFKPDSVPPLDLVGMHEMNNLVGNAWVKEERAVLKNVYDDIPKLLEREHDPWLRKTLKFIFDGQYKKAKKRMDEMLGVLRQNSSYYASLKRNDGLTLLATKLLEAGTNEEIGYSFIHVLASQNSEEGLCGERDHQKCRTLQMMLAMLRPETLQRALSLKCIPWAGRTPLHFTAATGQGCQMHVLQAFKPVSTTPDEMGMTPLLMAIIRDDLVILRELSWAGTDLQQVCDRTGHSVFDWKTNNKKFELGKVCVDFAKKRGEAFERVIRKWMEETTSMVQVKKGISEVHTVDCLQSSDHIVERIHINNEIIAIPHWIGRVNKTIHLRLRNNVAMEDRAFMYLIVIPFAYEREDETSPAEHPVITRHTLFGEGPDGRPRPIQFFPEAPFMTIRDPSSSRPPQQRALVPLFVNPHTGVFFAYKIGSDVFSHEILSITLTLDLSMVRMDLRESLRLLAQVVTLHPRTNQ